MSADSQHIKHVMLYEFRKGLRASQATKNINEVYSNGLNERTCRQWFGKFKNGDFNLEDQPRSGRPVEVDNDRLNVLVESDPRQTLRELATIMECSHEAIRQHLQQLGKILKHGVWVPHKLSDHQKVQRSTIAAYLRGWNNREPFLDRIVTGDEKWVLYVNIRRKDQWLSRGETPVPTPRAGIHPMKIMLSIWWDMKGVVHWELLDRNLTITAEIYCQQLDRLNSALIQIRPSLVNRKGVLLHHDNARPHIARLTIQKIGELGYEVMPHPAYSPDMAPSDYHLFRSLYHHLKENIFNTEEEVRKGIASFIASKQPEFFKRGIENLVGRWGTIIENEGEYIID